jgi:hypothetical protein
LRKNPSTLLRKLSAAFSTDRDAFSTVSAEHCISAIADETRCSTPTTDLVPEAAAATFEEISLVEGVLLFHRGRDRRGKLLDLLDAAADAADGAHRALS